MVDIFYSINFISIFLWDKKKPLNFDKLKLRGENILIFSVFSLCRLYFIPLIEILLIRQTSP